MKFSRAFAVAVTASLLAACGGHSGSIPSAPDSSMPQSLQQSFSAPLSVAGSATFVRMADNGQMVHFFPTRSTANAAAASTAIHAAGTNLVYGGGPIQPNPKVYVVFWGSSWNSGTGDPDHVAALLKNFYNGWNAASWPNTMTQYYGPTGTFIKDDTTFAGSYVDTTSTPPTHPSDASVGTEAVKAAKHFSDYSVDASYVVALPHGHDPTQFATVWCAWHSSEAGTGGTIQYTDLPYMPDGHSNCGSGSVNSPGTNDGVTIVGGHEQAETETDPRPCTGWCDSSGSEIGDKCAWINLQNTPFKNGTYPTQPLWSNKARGCVQ